MKDETKTPELFDMIKKGELRPFRQLVELYSADLNVKYISGYTPLMEAVYLQKEEFISYILTKMKNDYRRNASKYIDYLNAKSSDGKTCLMVATLTNAETKIIEVLLKEGADPTITDLHGKTARDYAPYAISDEVESFWSNFKMKNRFSLGGK